jgi:hypothetical protein
VQANLFDSGRRQEKAASASTKADFPFIARTQTSFTFRSKAIIRATLLNYSLLPHSPQ